MLAQQSVQPCPFSSAAGVAIAVVVAFRSAAAGEVEVIWWLIA
jgi:hypothetical protein